MSKAHGGRPERPLDAWPETYAMLHMYTQIVGKIRLELSPVMGPMVANSAAHCPRADVADPIWRPHVGLISICSMRNSSSRHAK
jgi:Family of unknown function (DUF5996)